VFVIRNSKRSEVIGRVNEKKKKKKKKKGDRDMKEEVWGLWGEGIEGEVGRF
jgi:hypothetical protein